MPGSKKSIGYWFYFSLRRGAVKGNRARCIPTVHLNSDGHNHTAKNI